MDIDLARTFLAVVGSGSFVAAAERLHLTQTAISARIRTLEEQVGRRLFIRNRSGARLTPAGERFRRDALILVQVWERARQRVALSASHVNVVSIGGELSLWNPVIVDCLSWMHRNRPEIALRAEVSAQSDLLDKVRSGALDVAVLYNPPTQADLAVALVTEEKLVMVTTEQDGHFEPSTYVHVDWGADFRASEQVAFPHLADPAVAVSLGPLALTYLLKVGGSGYFRLSAVRQYLADGRLSLVQHAPEFSHSVHMVYSERNDAEIVDLIRTGLRAPPNDA
jgi:DNA-binding transcriptional LysR family regulator